MDSEIDGERGMDGGKELERKGRSEEGEIRGRKRKGRSAVGMG